MRVITGSVLAVRADLVWVGFVLYIFQSMYLSWVVLLVSMTTSFSYKFNTQNMDTFEIDMRASEFNVSDKGRESVN